MSFAEQRMHHPERRVDHLYVLDENALRAYEVDELRAETLSHTELALIERHTVFCHFLQSGAGAHLLVFLGYALLVSESLEGTGNVVNCLLPVLRVYDPRLIAYVRLCLIGSCGMCKIPMFWIFANIV